MREQEGGKAGEEVRSASQKTHLRAIQPSSRTRSVESASRVSPTRVPFPAFSLFMFSFTVFGRRHRVYTHPNPWLPVLRSRPQFGKTPRRLPEGNHHPPHAAVQRPE